MHLLVIRHAQPEDQAGTGNNDGDPELSPLGHRQAAAVTEFLKGESIDRLVSSPMHRARQTGEPLAAHLGMDLEFDDDLKEAGWDAGAYLRSEEHMDEMIQAIKKNPDYFFEPEGRPAFTTRVVRAFSKVASENAGRTVAVFCHGMVTSTIVEHALGQEFGPGAVNPDYTGITRLQVSSNLAHWTVQSMNEHQHLRGVE